jgi:hypothetical protein
MGFRPGLLLFPGLLVLARAAPAQLPTEPDSTALPVTVDTAIGSRYHGGWTRRFLLGSDYRELWNARIAIPVLDLAAFAGGLTPVSRNGGEQWSALRFHAADGREFVFRAVERDPGENLPAALQALPHPVIQDQTSSLHPGASLVVTTLQEAAGVLHPATRLVLLPDDSLLGEFRRDYAGAVGTLEQRVAPPLPGEKAWGNASEIIDSDELFYRVERSPDDRVDVRALLRARLIDVLVGDWGRDRDQWTWVRFGDEHPRRWVPVARNPDYAMVSYDGLLMALGRTNFPQLVPFRGKYSGVLGLTWGGRELDRRWLMELGPQAWDSVTRDLRGRLTDSVLASAVVEMPAPWYQRNGRTTLDRLRERRKGLLDMSHKFYRMLAAEAELRATDQDDVATVVAEEDSGFTVSLRAVGTADSVPDPYLVRRFLRRQTRELRLFLGSGNDSAVVKGELKGLTLRIIGDSGTDVLADSTGRARLYDSDPGTVVVRHGKLDTRSYLAPVRATPSEIPARDWGHRWTPSTSVVTSSPDVGFFLGVGRSLTVYRFRTFPYASRHVFQAGVATGPWTPRLDYLGEWRKENSRTYLQLHARGSGIETISFLGFGNENPAPPGGKNYFRVTQQQYLLEPSLIVPFNKQLQLSAGPVARYVVTGANRGRFISKAHPYGDGNFGQVGIRGQLDWDTRDHPVAATRGFYLTGGGSAYPGWWGVKQGYAILFAEGSLYLSPPVPLAPTVALRLGARKNFGPYPYFDAATIGGIETVRLGRHNRFAGDASTYADTELRLALLRGIFGTGADLGVFGLADVGRVFFAGESSTKWHAAAGGGAWVSVFQPANTVSLSWARSEHRTAFYLMMGFGI